MSTPTTPDCTGICGPATVDQPTIPTDDVCLDGQTRWSLQPCTTDTVAVATVDPPAARLPDTGIPTMTAPAVVALVLIATGILLVGRGRNR